MTTSGTITYNETGAQICLDALQLLNVVAAGETASDSDLTFCMNALNKMAKAWMAQGIHLWTEEEGTVYITSGINQYSLQSGPSGQHASDGTGTPVETTNTSCSGNTVICLTVTGMSVNDTIGICQSNNTIFWSTISAINTASNTVTMAGSVTASVSVGSNVYTYTTQLARPLSLQSARMRDNNGFDRPIWIKPRNDYMMIPEKNIVGQPVILYYSPQLTNGQCYLWPTPNDVTQRLKITYLRTIQDFISNSDQPDFPQEWLECLTYNLAVRIAPAYGITLTSSGIQGNPDIKLMATQFLEDLKAWDAEQPYISIVPNYRWDR